MATKAPIELNPSFRGTTNTCVPSSDPIALDPPATIVARLAGVSKADLGVLKAQEFREAAIYLGRLYWAFEERELGEWALPNKLSVTGEAIVSLQLNRATAKIFGSHIHFDERFQRYTNYFNAVIPEIKRAANIWAQKTLQTQIETLSALEVEIANPLFSIWMSDAAREIWLRSAACRESERERILADLRMGYSGAGPSSPTDSNLQDLGLERSIRTCLVAATKSFIESSAPRNPQTPYDYVVPDDSNIELLTILLIHPRYTDLIEAYRADPSAGARLSQQLFKEAADATRNFAASLRSRPNSVWRYPVFIEGGIQELGLTDIDGLTEFAVNIGKHLDSKAADVLNYLGIGLLLIGLLSGGGPVLVVVLDIAAGGLSTYLTYLHEREQELAAKSSGFLLDDNKFASSYDGYAGTALGAAFLLLGVASLLRTRVNGSSPAARRVAEQAPAADLRPTRQPSDVRAVKDRGLTRPTAETAPTRPPPAETTPERPVSAKAESLQSLQDELKSVQQQIERLRAHPDAPVLQRDLDYIDMWAKRGQDTEARELLKRLTKRVEAAILSSERGVFDRVHEFTEQTPESGGKSGEFDQIRDRPPGVTKSQSKLWARVRSGEEVDLTRFENPPGERLQVDPDFKPFGENGPTNRELAADGRNCYLKNGDRVELHHRDQDPFAPLDEHSESYHRFVGEDPDFHPEVSDPGYESWRRHIAVFNGERRTLGDIYQILRKRYWRARFK